MFASGRTGCGFEASCRAEHPIKPKQIATSIVRVNGALSISKPAHLHTFRAANSVLHAASTLAAVSAMVQDVYAQGLDGNARAAAINGVMAKLHGVNWQKSATWSGIAGKMTGKGLAIGGPKEVAYNIFRAIVDPETPIQKVPQGTV